MAVVTSSATFRRHRSVDAVESVWAIFGVVAAVTLVTYWRLPASSMYHFSGSGLSAGLSRTVNYLAYPVALAAIAVVWATCSRRTAIVATVLCGCVFVPGAVSGSDVTASWTDVPPALGVLLAVIATLRSGTRPSLALSRARRWILALLGLCSVPWLLAMAGFYADQVPYLGWLMSSEATPGHRSLAAVHLGLHDGLFGVQLAATAVILAGRRLPRALSAYLSLLLVYGLALAITDGWSEQVVKRGWSGTDLPDIMQPSLGVGWLVILAAAAAVYLLWLDPSAPFAARRVEG